MAKLEHTTLRPLVAAAQPVLDYASPDQLTPSRVTVIMVRALAGIHLALGVGGLAWGALMVFFYKTPQLLNLPVIAAAIVHGVTGGWLLRRQPGSWRTSRALLASLLLPALGFIVLGVVLYVMYHEGTGWDGLGAAIGLALAIIASVPYWLNLLTLWYLMRPHPRAAFGVSPVESFRGRQTFVLTLAALWFAGLVIVAVAWIVP